MILKKLLSLNKSQKAFTLVELLIALAITAVIGTALTLTISQLLSISIADKNRTEVIKQVENGLHYLNRDVQMADPAQILRGDGNSFPLELTWIDPTPDDGKKTHIVTYSIETINGINCLQREEDIESDVHTNTIARYIDPDSSQYTFLEGDAVVTVKLTAATGGFRPATESRTLQVQPRYKPGPGTAPGS